jgi:peptidoglycan/LPS O-acetylase OafA/YrhL
LAFLLIFGLIFVSRPVFDILAKNQPDNHLVALLSQYVPVLFIAFISGACLFFYYRKFERYKNFLFLLSLVAYVVSRIIVLPLISSFFLSVIVVYLACSFKYLGNAGRYGDLSYGVYIWHFPVLQVLIAQGLFKDSPTLFLLFASLTVISIAFLSWHWIEKPFLRRTSHYRIASERKD